MTNTLETIVLRAHITFSKCSFSHNIQYSVYTVGVCILHRRLLTPSVCSCHIADLGQGFSYFSLLERFVFFSCQLFSFYFNRLQREILNILDIFYLVSVRQNDCLFYCKKPPGFCFPNQSAAIKKNLTNIRAHK